MMVLVALLAGVQLGCEGAPSDPVPDFENRPKGSIEDIAHLSEREDLNVLFIVIDTLRADRLSAYGYERQTSPVLDYLAGTGLRFDHHRSQSSWTKTSMASLWTSLYPQRVDVLTHRDTVNSEARMPAEIFADAGFTTAGIWRNGWVAPNFGFNQGFEIYLSPKGGQAPKAIRRKPIAGRINGTDIDAVYSATEYIRSNQDRRFFLYVHLMDVHQYVSTAETAVFGTSYSDAYDNSVLWEDQQVGEILAELYRLDMAKKTLVVLVSDHGEAFGEHGSEGHARDVHSEVTRTPFLIGFPFRLDPGLVIEHPTQNLDVFPTIFELLGIDAETPSDGKSRANWLMGDYTPDYPDRDYAHLDRTWGKASEDPDPVIGIRDGGYRIIHDVNNPDRDRLYDVKSDEGEFVNIAADAPGILDTMRNAALEYLQLESPFEGGAPEIELDEMSLRQLRALGYSIEE
jgi:arylsulfatase A-like enzyme